MSTPTPLPATDAATPPAPALASPTDALAEPAAPAAAPTSDTPEELVRAGGFLGDLGKGIAKMVDVIIPDVVRLSKGVAVYGYAADGFAIETYGRNAGVDDADAQRHRLPADGAWHRQEYTLYNAAGGMQYETKVGFRFRGPNGQEVYERSLRVNANDGDITREDMTNILERSRVTPTYCATYGVYNSDGAHLSDLTNQHQVYASVTGPQNNWQERLFAAYEAKHESAPLHLHQVLLPGSHDAGMYLDLELPALVNMANTQRDPIYTQLQLGARYFDFRPGYLGPDAVAAVADFIKSNGVVGAALNFFNSLSGDAIEKALRPYMNSLRHIHLFVPGETYDSFLSQIVRFLQENDQEIVVVCLAFAGFANTVVRKPTLAELQDATARALQGTELQAGTKHDLQATVADLQKLHRRLIILYQGGEFAEDVRTESTSSYSKKYESYNGDVVVEALRELNEISAADLKKVDLVEAQLQLTATGRAGAIARAIASVSRGTSPLLSTKPSTDAQSYPWVRHDLALYGRPLVTVSNDYYDNGLTDTVYHANLRRLNLT